MFDVHLGRVPDHSDYLPMAAGDRQVNHKFPCRPSGPKYRNLHLGAGNANLGQNTVSPKPLNLFKNKPDWNSNII